MKHTNYPVIRRVAALLCGALLALTSFAADEPAKPAPPVDRYPAASHKPDSMKGWQKFQTSADPDAPEDEPMGGFTAAHTPVNKRNPHCFPAERRNLFADVDRVYDEKAGALRPFDYHEDGVIHEATGRSAIRGQNTWMLWAEGNEVFWNWLQQHGYGLADFLILLDSRQRDSRFKRTGMMNQPGMKSSNTVNELGLYLDVADGDAVLMKQPADDIDEKTGQLATRPGAPPTHADPAHTEPFTPWDRAAFARITGSLAQDGVDPAVYGYPSGVVGLRLFPNPDFFGSTPAAEAARRHWKDTVIANPDRYYANADQAADPTLVRPYRVGMSCAFCHVGPHPLDPPEDVEAPKWENMSSTIGNQYWSAEKIFANLTQNDMHLPYPSFLRQFLASQQPGTIDTSLVSTDHINNANTIISIFDVPARLARAHVNTVEDQSAANLLLKSVEEAGDAVNPRHTPRILVDGADSVGAFGALARVYLNIGTHSDQWAMCHNPIIGFKPQRPFSIATLRKKSVYWNSADRERIPALRDFFTFVDKVKNKNIASPMKLAYASGGQAILDAEKADSVPGRAVFVDNCAICHSSKQPADLAIDFDRDWAKKPAPQFGGPTTLWLPFDYSEWRAFRASKAYAAYLTAIRTVASDGGFLDDNFLSTEVRVPVTLVGTNSARAVGTNAMEGQVWDNFSSDHYKQLPAVGPVPFFNPFSRATLTDDCCNNDYYMPPAGGPGYYRPASLISLWATAPYLHNNSLGIYTHDPSVASRLAAFDDGIDRLFSREIRASRPSNVSGDLRFSARDRALAARDVGMIYRTTESTQIAFNARFVRPLLVGIIGEGRLNFLTLWLWVALAVGFLLLAWFRRPRHVGFVLTVLAVLVAVLVVLGRFDRITGHVWWIPAVAILIAVYFFLSRARALPVLAAVFFVLMALGSGWIAYLAHGFAAGERGGIALGPIPRGTPVSLIMNMNPEAPLGKTLRSATALIRGIELAKRENTDEARLRVFESEAGQALLEASKCPDFVLDRGHWFAEHLSPDEKRQLKAFLKTL